MTQQEQLIAKIFDNSVDALGLMAKKIAESIEKEPSEQALRDNFAKAAMQAIMGSDRLRSSAVKQSREHGMLHTDFVAQCAYDIAEALMQERERRMKG